ncbi:MAG: type I-B CRISPR-associated protein Cas7/Cst2/DevR [Deltaproteobacteria bacterium]|nr:type I-B CRISPR-associated protein Cas7/Cst2/DevR [Deltaproteobacteria bacterium]
MSFVTSLILIDAPASALNNLGNIPGARTDNTVGVKLIRTRDGAYPYVSAQAFRYWLRTTLQNGDSGWQAAPIYREEKVAYTDANPILWWDDDLFGYMRAPSKKTSAREKREVDETRADETQTTDTVTRVSPFRVSTLVSIAPVNITEDFGTMSRHDGDPVPHEHQFYRTTLKGLFSLDLKACGTFSYRSKTGFRNLDDVRSKLAVQKGLKHLNDDKSYRLSHDERVRRISALFKGLVHLEGGAKLALHYTDVAPAFVILAVTNGGNHIFGHIIGATSRGLPELKIDALAESLYVFNDDIESNIYIGWIKGYMDDERIKFEAAFNEGGQLAAFSQQIKMGHPREVFKNFITDLNKPENADWMA